MFLWGVPFAVLAISIFVGIKSNGYDVELRGRWIRFGGIAACVVAFLICVIFHGLIQEKRTWWEIRDFSSRTVENESNNSVSNSECNDFATGELSPVAYSEYPALEELNTVSINGADSDSSLDFSKYGPLKTVDGNDATCWQDGSEGYALNEKLYYDFSDTYYEICGVRIRNGRTDSSSKFEQNGRIKKAELDFGNDQRIIVNLDDEDEAMFFEIGARDVSECTFTILEVYEGSKYEDTCLSEVTFYCK